MARCSLCHGAGWVLDCRLSKRPLMLELIECPVPDCEASGRELRAMSFKGPRFTHVSHHPATGVVMSVTA